MYLQMLVQIDRQRPLNAKNILIVIRYDGLIDFKT